MFVLVIGPASAGKTSIARRLSKGNILINLDPATPSEADIDIRKWVRTEEVQAINSLGINGALLKSMEMISGMDEWICPDTEKIKIVDTPGQLELFLYRDYGKRIVEKLARHDAVVSLFLMDAEELCSLENYLVMLAQNAIINLKLLIPSVTAINKIDLTGRKSLEKLVDRAYVEKMLDNGDALRSLSRGLVDYIEYTTISQRPLFVSAKTGEGIEELYGVLHEVHCACGDLS
ncbi:MAG: hypothetical protein FE046_03300 [Thermoplasmata archaeon]|nr:MAG: hypothetical protein FE046_03300 [Thermoplasmata archaeon]